MSNKTLDLRYELHTSINLAHKAGQMALDVREKGIEVQYKGSHFEPVSQADLFISRFLIEKLTETFPEDLIVSEENLEPPYENHTKRIWYIDPIDGTAEFIQNRNEWSIMIGLTIEGSPCLGVIYQPEKSRLYYAISGKGAFLRTAAGEKRLKVNNIANLKDAVLIQSRSHMSKKAQQLANSLGMTKTIVKGSIGLKIGKMAEGYADLYCNFSGKCGLWDTCAPEVVLNEAEGMLKLASGKKICYDPKNLYVKEIFFATNKKIWAKLSK